MIFRQPILLSLRINTKEKVSLLLQAIEDLNKWQKPLQQTLHNYQFLRKMRPFRP